MGSASLIGAVVVGEVHNSTSAIGNQVSAAESSAHTEVKGMRLSDGADIYVEYW